MRQKESLFKQKTADYLRAEEMREVIILIKNAEEIYVIYMFTGKCFDIGLQVNGGCSTAPKLLDV